MRTPLPLAALVTLAGCVLAACADRCVAIGHPTTLTTLRPPADEGSENVDLLLVIDNSGSMADRQRAVGDAIGGFVDALTYPPVDPETRRPRFQPVKSLHIGVVSTDLGTPGSAVPSCADAGQGDDGLLNPIRNGAAMRTHQPWASAPPGRPARCTNDPDQFPSFLRFDRMTSDLPSFAEEVACTAHLSTSGCGLEQPLEAAYRALVVRNARAVAGNTDPNAGFVRDNAVLAIVVVTDEEDGSVRDCRYAERGAPCHDATSVFDITSTRWSSGDLNLRFYNYVPGSAQDPTWPLDRYFDPDHPARGFTGLKPGRPGLVVFAAIAGVPINLPTRTVDGDATVDWDALLGRNPDGSDGYAATTPEGAVSMRPRTLDPACPGRVVPACHREGAAPAAGCDPAGLRLALPSRRLAALARRFDERYRNGTVASICRADLGGAFAQVAARVQRRLGAACLGVDPPLTPAPCERGSGQQGCVRAGCAVREILPAGVSAATACVAERGREPGPPDAQLMRDTCFVRQIPVPPRGAAPDGAVGFYFDTRVELTNLNCVRRITFTPSFAGSPGATYMLECVQAFTPDAGASTCE